MVSFRFCRKYRVGLLLEQSVWLAATVLRPQVEPSLPPRARPRPGGGGGGGSWATELASMADEGQTAT